MGKGSRWRGARWELTWVVVGLERAAAWAGGGGRLLCSKAAGGGATRWFSGQGKGQNDVVAVRRCSSSKWPGVGGCQSVRWRWERMLGFHGRILRNWRSSGVYLWGFLDHDVCSKESILILISNWSLNLVLVVIRGRNCEQHVMGKISSVPSWEILGERWLGWLGLVHGVGEAWRRRWPRWGAGTGVLGSGRWHASSSTAVLWKQGSLAEELGRAERVGPRMGNRKARGEVGYFRFWPDKVLKFENGFLFILIWFKL
jgi:hypothetical protein